MLIEIYLRMIVEVIKFQYYSLSLHPNYIVTIFNWALSNWPKMVGLKFRKLSMSNGKAFFSVPDLQSVQVVGFFLTFWTVLKRKPKLCRIVEMSLTLF